MQQAIQNQDKLEIYLNLLKKWQSKINLVSNNTIENAWERHFEDSLQILPLIPETTKVIFDLGSGAGFPGLVIAIERDDVNVHLIESDQKKCSFMRNVSRETKTNINIHNARIEEVKIDNVPDVITARALASLNKLFEYCHKWIKENPNLTLIFLKGERADEELELLKNHWEFKYCTYKSKTDQNAKILVFTEICAK